MVGWVMNWVCWGLAGLVVLLGAALSLEAIAEARDFSRFPPPGQMVDVGGRRLHVLCKGPASGPTVVIEQGAGSPSILWWPIQNQVATFARVCTYDRAGYLWSDDAGRTRSLAERATDLHAVLVGAHVPGPYVMVGHSFGGPLIRLFAQRYPKAVAGMVLVDTPEEGVILRASYNDYVTKMGYFAKGLEAASRIGLTRIASLFLTEVPRGLSKHDFDALKALAVRPAFFRAMADDPASFSREPDVLRALSGAGSLGDKPLVVITHGQRFPGPAAVLEDGWLDGQHRLAALSRRGTLIVAEHSNHMVQSDQPEIVVDAIRRVYDAVQMSGPIPPMLATPYMPPMK
jgi:pimeloyl-ACP methyl ester carboxylesterase